MPDNPPADDLCPLSLDELFPLALDEDHVLLAHELASVSDEGLGALLDACRRLTRQVRVELRRRAWAREDAPAEAGEGTP